MMSKMRLILFVTTSVFITLSVITMGHAGVVLDGTLGRSGPLTGPDYRITQDLGRTVGQNLFHSFSSFSLGLSESAIFSGQPGIHHVISRVTGGEQSLVNGFIRSEIPGADLYLINPAGIVFGSAGRLDVKGSFHASTADYLLLGTDGKFDALHPQDSVLRSASPSAFGFLSQTPGPVSVGGLLQPADGKVLSLSGGLLSLDNAILYAPSGTVALTSVASPGLIPVSAPWTSSQGISRWGDITAFQSTIAADGIGQGGIFIRGGRFFGDEAVLQVVNRSGGKGGGIDVRLDGPLSMYGGLLYTNAGSGDGGDIRVRASDVLLYAGTQCGTNTSTVARAGDISISAPGRVEVSGSGGGYRSAVISGTTATGRSGDIIIDAGSFMLDHDALLATQSSSRGTRGDVFITAGAAGMFGKSSMIGANIMFDVGLLDIEEGSTIWSPAPGSGEGRSIRVNATDAVVIKGEDQVEASWRNKTEPLYTGMHTDVFANADGNAGDIIITSPLIRITNSGQIGARTYTDGHGGVISVSAGRIELLSGGEIASDSFGSSLYQGPAGDVNVRASEAIFISGENGEVRSGFSSSTRSDANAGRISISTPHLTIEESGVIMTATGVFGAGGAGRISIDAGRVDIRSGGGITSSSSGYGDKGAISVTASEEIIINDGYIVSFGSSSGKAGDISLFTPVLSMTGGEVSTVAYENLDAGNVIIETSGTMLSAGARISSESRGFGNAGQLRITASELLRSEASSVTTAASFSTGGNILIQGGDIQILDGTQVTATVAGGTGNGGNVTIHAKTLVGLGNSDITARADQGFGGNIAIEAEAVLLSKDSDLNASSNVIGQEGVVEVNAPRVDVSNNLAVLPESLLDIEAFMPKRCAVREDELSTFVVKGRDGIPPRPESLIAGQ